MGESTPGRHIIYKTDRHPRPKKTEKEFKLPRTAKELSEVKAELEESDPLEGFSKKEKGEIIDQAIAKVADIYNKNQAAEEYDAKVAQIVNSQRQQVEGKGVEEEKSVLRKKMHLDLLKQYMAEFAAKKSEEKEIAKGRKKIEISDEDIDSALNF